MKLPRGVRSINGRLYGRIYVEGGEESFQLGPTSDPGPAIQRFYTIRAMIRDGKDPAAIKDALNGDGLTALRPPTDAPEPEAQITVAQAVERWIRERVRPDLKNAQEMERLVDRLVLPFLGPKPIREVRRSDCFTFKGHVRTTCPHVKPGTMTLYIRPLRELLAWAENVELIPESPWPRKGIMPRTEKKPPDRLTDEEVEVLVNLPEPWGGNLRLALGTGCRWGELVRLRRRDLQSDGVLLIREAKDGEPRTVPVGPALLREIMQRKGPLFSTRKDAPYSEKSNGAFNATIRRQAKKRLAELTAKGRRELGGLARFHVHMTRHTFACRYIEAGGELAMLQEILGHGSVTTTQRYGRPNEKAIRADAARVHGVLERNFRSRPEIAV